MLTCTFENGNVAKLRHVVVDTLVLQGDKILLVKRAAQLIEGGKWGLVGGYVERDENLPEAVAREVREETGYIVNNVQLLTIRDNPGRRNEDRQNISFVFVCEAQQQVGESDWEVEDQQWFSLSAIPPLEQVAFDHRSSIELYIQCLTEKITLPILPWPTKG